MSPDSWMPPSATRVTPCRFAATAQSWIAVICGTPTPATTRVVQIELWTITFSAMKRVRWAVDLDVVDRDRRAEVTARQLLHDLVVGEVATLMSEVEPRAIAREAPLRRRARQAARGSLFSSHLGKGAVEQVAEHAEELGQVAGRVAEALAAVRSDVAIADHQTVVQALQVEGCEQRYLVGRCFCARLPNSPRSRAHCSE